MFWVGLHVGDLIVDGDDLYGDGVNVAARLEGGGERRFCHSAQALQHERPDNALREAIGAVARPKVA